ncbi:hypothetical protein KUG12_23390 [Streptomyces sp. BV333]|uniref:hypothetical protein n=1 Tax=unclassified Streptomyces TaxID=2593676 RepID=UPI001C2E19C5|nr:MULTISPECIES: hypothetical protein [unclassified Streptomyces]MBV1957251.1 hypothetical protein [Streptomyces sp. BV333]MCG5122697.1 hypothetical protein [Streptomyces sp. T7(2022)]
MSTAVRASAFNEPERPKNLQIRFATIGGSFVDVTGLGENFKNRWKCHGCKATSQFPEADYLFRIREKANDHAAACRAIPLT